jgi:hypothetical protein
MMESLLQWLQAVRNTVGRGIISRLLKPRDLAPERLTDFSRLKTEIRGGDVLLVEGHTQVGQIIQIVTHSRWSHSALCVGRVNEFKYHLADSFDVDSLDQNAVYLVEAELGKGTVLTPIDHYQGFRLRVCRPAGLSREDQSRVACYVIKRLGTEYNVRQLADLARFMFPYGVLPRRWRSTLFEHNAGPETKIVCTTLIADAFQAVKFPVLPIVSDDMQGESRLFKRNAKLFAPSDFDISPYFQILKFPVYSIEEDELRYYHHLPWAGDAVPAEPHQEIDPSYTRDKSDNSDETREVKV